MKIGSDIMSQNLVEIDGSVGEGGGQIVRSSLALAICTGKPCRLRKIRARRKRPGLLRQHFTALKAAAAVSQGKFDGELGSDEVAFSPGSATSGNYRFSIGTAGSTTLVLQTVLPALLTANGPSELVLEGGTHNPMAPPFDFLERAFLPLLSRMGPSVTAKLERPGFSPAGGGRVRVSIEPSARLSPLVLTERGAITGRKAVARVANLSPKIARRELEAVGGMLSWNDADLCVEQVDGSRGPGNVLTLEVVSENATELFTGFGQRAVTAERVAQTVAAEVRSYLASGAPVGPYLADQLLLPLALAGSGRLRTTAPTSHTLTNAEIIKQFVDVEIDINKDGPADWIVEVRRRGENGDRP